LHDPERFAAALESLDERLEELATGMTPCRACTSAPGW
jgi:hypothetical protein